MAKTTTAARCSIATCDKLKSARGLCSTHYRRFRVHGDPLHGEGNYKRYDSDVCSYKDCLSPRKGRGFCAMHYRRFMTHGEMDRPVRRSSGEGNVDKQGYRRITVPKGTPNSYPYRPGHTSAWILEHRYVMSQHLGRELTRDETVHHINGNRTDNRIENLELWAGGHSGGQRVEDLVDWALALIDRYPDVARARRENRGLELFRQCPALATNEGATDGQTEASNPAS